MSQREFIRQMPGQTGASLSPGLAVRLHLDPPLLVGLLLLMFGGLTVLYSAGGESMDLVVRQCIRFGAGLTVLFLLAQIPPRSYRFWAPVIYSIGLVLLVLVLVVGTEAKGAQRWLSFPGRAAFNRQK